MNRSKVKQGLKKIIPESVKSLRRYIKMTPEQREIQRLMRKDYSYLPLSKSTENSVETVKSAAKEIYGENLGYYTRAMWREAVYTFEKTLDDLAQRMDRVRYLEIGSAQGLSMSIIGLMLREKKLLQSLTSIDPYFEDGYKEGAKGIWGVNMKVEINKKTRDQAIDLYKALKLEVNLIEKTSLEGLRELIIAGEKFHLIYIDGSHEGLNPAIDFGISCSLLHKNGIMMLDDILWPDVKPLNLLCLQHAKKVSGCWKVASYRPVI